MSNVCEPNKNDYEQNKKKLNIRLPHDYLNPSTVAAVSGIAKSFHHLLSDGHVFEDLYRRRLLAGNVFQKTKQSDVSNGEFFVSADK